MEHCHACRTLVTSADAPGEQSLGRPGSTRDPQAASHDPGAQKRRHVQVVEAVVAEKQNLAVPPRYPA
jgi:hypothetical protein